MAMLLIHSDLSIDRLSRMDRQMSIPDPCCPSVLAAPLGVEAADELAAAFSALADPVRLRLLSLVAAAGEVCSCDLQEPLGKSQPTVSHHTKILSEAGLITGEKRGRWVWWSVAPDRLDQLRAALGPRSEAALGRR
jgi:ArsR family transcriptional regulator, arsenate/arsenite/antimonite-responsive transcriptional repressor